LWNITVVFGELGYCAERK